MKLHKLMRYAPYILCLMFFIAYSLLSVIRHLHVGSGFDLGIADQIVWKYSQLKAPITTIQFYVFTSLLTDHVELIYILLAPFYWIYSSPITLLLLQTFFITSSALPLYWYARKKEIKPVLSFTLMVSYLTFYGIQNAIWFDVHSIVFGVAFLPWLIYFLDKKHTVGAVAAFVLAVISKEDVALLTFLICFVFYVKERSRLALYLMLSSILYLAAIFFVYFPHLTQDGYRYANKGGLLSDVNPYHMIDTPDKRQVYGYSLGWFGLLSLLSPLYLIPAVGDIFHYFVLGNNIEGAHGLSLHYRVSMAVLLLWPAIISISKIKKLNAWYTAVYLLIIAAALQYSLHVPLTYLSKKWFWTSPQSISSINKAIKKIPKDASVVSQNNITPHIAHRDQIFTLWPEKKAPSKAIKCSTNTCNWFRWSGNPQYLIVDTAGDWDIRHMLANREDFIDGIKNLESNQYIRVTYREGTTTLYSILKHP